jgi:SAM-dependent methyltransferase
METARHLVVAAAVVFLLGHGLATARAQQPPSPPTAEEVKAYETFRAWFASQPPEFQKGDDAVVFRRYSDLLQSQGQSAQQAASTIDLLRRLGDRAEVERWNRILTAPTPAFNTAPNAFLVAMITGARPGRSLDVGMGQGRNTIYLAQQGWDSVGFDPADRAVASAQERAKSLGVTITATVARDEDFDWGESQWDLIVLSYVGAREYAEKVTRALRPGGMVVVEAFHRDATKAGPIGGAVVFDTNELLRLFAALRVVRYEDADAMADFGQRATRVVRLAAVKP